MRDNTFLILPGCDDTNRGDQALIWVTVDLAKKAGFEGTYKMLAYADQCAQSAKEGIGQVNYVLEHPSARFRNKNNVHYTPMLKLKWACAAVLDLLKCEPLVHPLLRKLWLPFCGEKTQKAVEEFQKAKTCFVKGGGFLHAHGGFADTYKIYYFLYHIRLAQSFGADVIVMPNSFGPFNSPFVKGMIRRTLSKCRVVMARESISAGCLQESCGVQAETYADLAFHLQEDQEFDSQKHLNRLGIPVGQKPCVAITARPYRFPGEADGVQKYENYKNSLAEFAVWLDQNGFYPVFVEHVFSDMDHENDMTCIRQIQERLKDKCEFSVFSGRELSCRQMKNIYAAFDYVVGTRFHSVIFSLASGTPGIAITYGGNKGDGIMRDLGMEGYAIPIHQISSGELIRRFKMLHDNRDETTSLLCSAMEQMAFEKAQIVSRIKELRE